MTRYYELQDDRYHSGRWHLRSPLDEQGHPISPWQFFKGTRLDFQGAIRFPVKPDGVELDFSWAAFSIPVVHVRFVQLLERLGIREVQFLPVQIDGHSGPWFILNTLHILRCIDDSRCTEVQYWQPEDDQPEKVGKYRYVAGMRIDPTRAGDIRIFRPWGWSQALVVSEYVKAALEKEGITGTKFIEV